MKLSAKLKRIRRPENIQILIITIIVLIIVILIKFTEKGNEAFKTVLDSIFWVFVTITTTGYGDQVPKSLPGRVIAVFTMIFGIVIVSVFTGKISSFLVEQKLNKDRGLNKLKNLKNHIVICGWKNDIKYLIKDILLLEKGVELKDIVIINNIDREKVTPLLMDEELKGIHYLSGDYSEESTLNNANIKKAKKALVLADILSGNSDEVIDSKVLVTVLLLHSLNPDIYVCAEVVTVKYKNYLEHMKCEEVVLVEEYTRFLLANATVYSGITKVVSKLLNNEEGDTIKLIRLEPNFEGKSFLELSEHYKKKKSLSIGVVENMGIERDFKRNALSEAQKAPDISTLVKNLKGIKEIERNKIILNPSDNYIIKKNSGLIVISR